VTGGLCRSAPARNPFRQRTAGGGPQAIPPFPPVSREVEMVSVKDKQQSYSSSTS
jgi:hypothetical protein